MNAAEFSATQKYNNIWEYLHSWIWTLLTFQERGFTSTTYQ